MQKLRSHMFYFMASTRTLWKCYNTRPGGLIFKQFSREPANVKAKFVLLVDLGELFFRLVRGTKKIIKKKALKMPR